MDDFSLLVPGFNGSGQTYKIEEAETIEVPPPLTEKLLVLGANGFVGSHVCKEALDRGLTVASLSRSSLSSSLQKRFDGISINLLKTVAGFVNSQLHALKPQTLIIARSHFGKLGKMIANHQRLKEHSRFLFIPGPDDLGPSNALPRCSLPKYITEEFQNHIPNAVFLSNPCRIKFYSQEIVFLRQDMLYRMRRSCLMPPLTEETSDPFEHLVATIMHQSHLCPLPLSVQPIIWNFDHCLHLYPTPQTIVLGDRSEQKAFKYTGVTCFNPGSFSNDFTFVAYRPCSQEVELSAV